MIDEKKNPVILVIDDDLAKDKWSKVLVENCIAVVAAALGYDEAQRTVIQERVRFFAQFNDVDGPLRGDEYAAHYISDRKAGTELPVLAFVDNQFAGPRANRPHGKEIVTLLQEAADSCGEMRPAIVWVSSTRAPDNIIAADKDQLAAGLRRIPAETIHEFAKRPHDKKHFKDHDGQSQQVLIHTLRDAFEQIAASPNKKPWQTRVDISTGGTAPPGPG